MPITRSTFASPISESELFVKLGEIHAVEGRDAVQSAYVTEIYWPEEFSVLKDRFANLDELNYLGKCMEGLDTLEYDQFIEVLSQKSNIGRFLNFGKLNYRTACSSPSLWSQESSASHLPQISLL